MYDGSEISSLELMYLQIYVFSTNSKWQSDGFNLHQAICYGFQKQILY